MVASLEKRYQFALVLLRVSNQILLQLKFGYRGLNFSILSTNKKEVSIFDISNLSTKRLDSAYPIISSAASKMVSN